VSTRSPSSIKPLADKAVYTTITDAVFDKAHQPLVTDRIEESRDIGVHYPVHLRAGNPNGKSVQRIMLAAPRSEPIREPEEIFFVDCVQHFHHSPLNDFIFQRSDAQRALPPIRFWDIPPS
jgi:hypothetical protein